MSEVKMEDPQDDAFYPAAKSSVKLTKNSKGINWVVKCVIGEEKLLEGLMIESVRIHKLLEGEFKDG